MVEALKHSPNYKIHHIGSTSIRGIKSKPIIDVLLEFNDRAGFRNDISAISQLGFEYKGDAIGNLEQKNQDTERHFFSFYNKEENIDYIHLHALPRGHPHLQNLLLFRDALNLNPDLALEYERLKIHLKSDGNIRRQYTLEKSEFVSRVLSHARNHSLY